MSSDDLQIPDGHTLLHIGPQKTGSTGLQQAMHQSRDKLAHQGVLYPGPQFRPAEAGWSVMSVGSAVGRRAPRPELWERLVHDVATTTLPRVCVSNEDFARATPAAIERIVNGLGGDRIELVYVARRLDKLLPSHWQERVKARMTWSYPEFLERMMAPVPSEWEWRMMWEPQMAGDVVAAWANFVDRDRITVIVSDDADRGLLPSTFERLLGLSAGTLVPPTVKSNRSLSYAEAEAVRRINRVWAEQHWSAEAYWRIVQAGVAGMLKNSPTTHDDTPVPGLPASAFDRVADLADQQVETIRAAGVRVVGDPDTLRIRDLRPATDEPIEVEAISMDLFANVLQGAVTGALELQQRSLRQQRRQIEKRIRRELGGRELVGLLRRRTASRLRRSR